VYYIRVRPLDGFGLAGTYQIAFNTGGIPPGGYLDELTAGTWKSQSVLSDRVRWFRFTATASTQFLHVRFGTLTNLWVQVYDSTGAIIGSETNLSGSTAGTAYTSRSVSSGQVYYIRIRRHSSSQPLENNFNITFNTSSSAPVPPGFAAATQLSADTWAGGSISYLDNAECFKFTATASTQYIHVMFGSLDNLYVQLLDSTGNPAGSITNLSGSTTYTSESVSSGQAYYIVVYSSGSSGSYQIAFNTGSARPAPVAAQLSANTWVYGNIASAGEEQWFRFIAAASTQYIHFTVGSSSRLNVQLYDSTGYNMVDSEAANLTGNTYISRTVTIGEVYYIRVMRHSSASYGAYHIAFNTGSARPALSEFAATAAQLSANTWANGNIASTDEEQWFTFTATTIAYHYFHFIPDSQRSLSMQVYDSMGNPVEFPLSLMSITPYISVASGEYYIRVKPDFGIGTYRIAFNTSSTPPPIQLPIDAAALSANTWANGNIASAGEEQWFTFTATTTGSQYIHASFGTLTDLYVQLYDSAGNEVGGYSSNLYSGSRYTSRSVSSGQVYYIRVRPRSGSGTYQIKFNTSYTP
jgi:hypothetical protein